MAQLSAEPLASLYVHVPFCVRKCAYCAFYSEPSSGELIERYVGALTRELERVAPDLTPHTIFFGGGTPSLLSPSHLQSILDTCRSTFVVAPGAELTLEANPGTITVGALREMREMFWP